MSQREAQEIKGQIYEQFAQIGKALGSASRLELLDLLAQSEYTVDNLAQEAGLSVANTSQHLKTLRTARLVEVRREGVVAYYSLANEDVFRTWQSLRRLGETRSIEIEWLARQLTPDRNTPAIISLEQLLALLESGGVTVLDVRPEMEYEAGHIAGAQSIPLEVLPGRLEEIESDREVIVYCRGPFSTLAYKATLLLQDHGYQTRRLAEGLPEWRARGLPVCSGLEPISSAS